MPNSESFAIRISVLCGLLLISSSCCTPCRRHARAVAAAPGARPPAPFDLVKNPHEPEKERVDMNGIFRDPVWGWQLDNFDPARSLYRFADPDKPEYGCLDMKGAFTKPSCTTQQTFCDLPSGWFHPAICALGGKCRIRGHINWEVGATYEGPLVWDQEAVDQDYDLFLYPPLQAGLTQASCTRRNKAFGIEFDSRETTRRIIADDREFWWVKLRDAVDQGDEQFVDQQVNKKFAIITGLLNLDCEHECTAELHPVWAIAIHTQDDPSDDRWALLVRNWGDEGFCSSEQHYIEFPNRQFVLRIPWRSQASSVEVDTQSSKFWLSSPEISSPMVTYTQNEAAYVKFPLPAPESQPLIFAELHLRWKDGQVAPVNPPVVINTTCELAAPPASQLSAEERLVNVRKLLKQDPEKLERYNERLAARVQQSAVMGRFVQIGAAVAEPSPLAAPASPPASKGVSSPQKVKDDDTEGEALCAAFKNNIPGLPDACKRIKKR